jgi:hypothetical protein
MTSAFDTDVTMSRGFTVKPKHWVREFESLWTRMYMHFFLHYIGTDLVLSLPSIQEILQNNNILN